MAFTEPKAAQYIGVNKRTLTDWRLNGIGPPYKEIPEKKTHKIFYAKQDLDDFINSRKEAVRGLLRADQAEEYLGVRRHTLQVHRKMGTGPEYIKLEENAYIKNANKRNQYFYSKEALDAYKYKRRNYRLFFGKPMISLRVFSDRSGIPVEILACLRAKKLGPGFITIKDRIFYEKIAAEDYIYTIKYKRPRLSLVSGLRCIVCESQYTYWNLKEEGEENLFNNECKFIYCSTCGIEWAYV